jgi:hypothetical protein
MIAGFERAARARLRNFEASRRWIPNRLDHPLQPAEHIAEEGGDHLLEAARATGNWSVVNILAALAVEDRLQRKATKGKRA